MIGKADYKQQMQLLSEGNNHQFYPTGLLFIYCAKCRTFILLTTSRMLLLSILLLLTGMVIMARPPSPDEIKKLGEQQQVNYSKDDYDVLPDVGHIPESFKESLKKQKTLYLEMLRQHNL
ncbi:Uncharacterized protein BM_BM10529 [Brugia malayi]|uniref:Bm10529, isoform a n=1 Tax=Brugia malayi TaxID=6279 RepID=A0A0H5SAT1_BRUMA|nr:Uncharacterized protein BM_BM10529 [Brugia malayi]CRZ25225.1 Bm10529, isoform a [Brugia malayi]VIO98892.1 Uncharacterized protein BM_BM10529 [Brugia malayi]